MKKLFAAAAAGVGLATSMGTGIASAAPAVIHGTETFTGTGRYTAVQLGNYNTVFVLPIKARGAFNANGETVSYHGADNLYGTKQLSPINFPDGKLNIYHGTPSSTPLKHVSGCTYTTTEKNTYTITVPGGTGGTGAYVHASGSGKATFSWTIVQEKVKGKCIPNLVPVSETVVYHATGQIRIS